MNINLKVFILFCCFYSQIHKVTAVITNTTDTYYTKQTANIELIAVSNNMTTAAAALWTSTVYLFNTYNLLYNNVTNKVNIMYGAPQNSSLDAFFNTNKCSVSTPTQYIANATKLVESLCCFVRNLRIPRLKLFILQLTSYFYGTPVDFILNSPEIALNNINILMKTYVDAISTQMCKDDVTIHIPNALLTIADGSQEIVGVLYDQLQYTNLQMQSLLTCLNQPTLLSPCITNINSNISLVLSTNTDLFETYDLSYSETCSSQALVAFENYRLSPVC